MCYCSQLDTITAPGSWIGALDVAYHIWQSSDITKYVCISTSMCVLYIEYRHSKKHIYMQCNFDDLIEGVQSTLDKLASLGS